LTTENWSKVERRLENPYDLVKLKIDGYNVTIAHARVKPLKYCLIVYIDGKFKMEWLLNDCDIRRRFCRRRTKSMLTANQKKALKRERKAFREEVEKKMTLEWYEPYWNTVKTLKSHLIKNNKSIELMEDNYGMD
jgi:hypothetical protein